MMLMDNAVAVTIEMQILGTLNLDTSNLISSAAIITIHC